MVVELLRQGFAKPYRNEEVVERWRGCARREVRLPSHPSTIYRSKGEGSNPLCPSSKEGVAAPRGWSSPQGRGAPPSRVSPPALGCMGLGERGARPTKGWCASLYSPCGPLGKVDPLVDPRTPFGTPGTIPKNPETFPVTKIGLPIYKSLPPDHS
jgi:hypothetical protein